MQSPILALVLAFAVLASAIYAFGDSASPAWRWAVVAGAALAAVVFAEAWSERVRALSEPFSIKMRFVAARLVLPLLVLTAAAAAGITGSALWHDAAAILAVALALAALL